jgi:hypothetical protein
MILEEILKLQPKSEAGIKLKKQMLWTVYRDLGSDGRWSEAEGVMNEIDKLRAIQDSLSEQICQKNSEPALSAERR